jgi:hypothetical protein
MLFALAAAPFAVIGAALLLFTVRSLHSPRGLAAPPRPRGGQPRRAPVDPAELRGTRRAERPMERPPDRSAEPAERRAPALTAAIAQRAPSLETANQQARRVAAAARERVAPAVASLPSAMGPLAARMRESAARAKDNWPRLDPQAAPERPSVATVGLLIGALALVAAVALLVTRDAATSDADAVAATGTAAPAAAETPSETSTPTAVASAFSDAGQPYSGEEIARSFATAGLAAGASDDNVPCTNSAVPPRPLRVTRADGSPGEQRVALMVYPSAQAMQAQWAIGGGSARYSNGSCGIGAAVIYWNANAILMIFQITDPALRQQVSSAFLAATP